MAKPDKIENGKQEGGKAIWSTIAAAAVVVALSSAAGIVSGMHLRSAGHTDTSPPALSVARTSTDGFQVLTLPSVVTNLAQGGWIRLELAVLVEGSKPVQTDLAARLAQDTAALMRTISARQISGPSGFLHLREELLDRMKVRSSDRVRDIMIQSLVIE